MRRKKLSDYERAKMVRQSGGNTEDSYIDEENENYDSFIDKPCTLEAEKVVMSFLDKLPLFTSNSVKSYPVVIYKAHLEAFCETVTVIEEKEHYIGFTYDLPAGYCWNLALEMVEKRLGLTGRIWGMLEEEIRKALSQPLALNSSKRKRKATQDEIESIVRLAALIQALLQTHALGRLGPMLRVTHPDDNPIKLLGRMSQRYRNELYHAGELVLDTRGFINESIATEQLNAWLDMAGLHPHHSSRMPPSSKLWKTIIFNRTVPTSTTITSLFDILYYSMHYFGVRNEHCTMRRCPICGRVTFAYHGTSEYCAYRCPERDGHTCASARDRLTALDKKRYKKKNEELKQDICGLLSNHQKEKEFKGNCSRLENFFKVVDNIRQHQIMNEWLQEQYKEITGQHYLEGGSR